MDDFTSFKTEFISLFCRNSLNIVISPSEYDVRVHKTVTCVVCDVAHAVNGEEWKQFCKSVNSSSLSHEQKIVFLDKGVKPKVFTEQNRSIIFALPDWVDAQHALKQHQMTLKRDTRQLCELGEPFSSLSAQKGLQCFFCNDCSTTHVLSSTVFTNLLNNQLREKQQIVVGMETKLPSLIIVHLEKLLGEQIQLFHAELQLEYVFDSNQFAADLTKTLIDATHTQEEILHQHFLHTTAYCRKDGSTHFAPSSVWQHVHDELAVNKKYLKREVLAQLNSVVGRKISNSEPAFEQALKSNEQWQEQEQRLAEMQKIVQEAAIKVKLSTAVETRSFHRKITPSMTFVRKDRVNYYSLSEQQYEDIAEQLHPLLIASYEYLTQTTKLTETFGLMKLRRMLRRAFGVIDEESGGEVVSKDFLYLEDKNLSDELMVEFHVCGRKQGHRTKALALMDIIMNGRLQSTIYHCDYCNNYHYGWMTQSMKSFTDFAGQGRIHYRDDIQKANRFAVKKNLAWA